MSQQDMDFRHRPQLSRRQVVQAGLAGALVGGLGGIGLLAVPGAARAQGAARTIRILRASPLTLPVWSVMYLAEDLGFLKEEGIAVEHIGLNSGPAAMTALLAGEGAADLSPPGEMLAAVAKGQSACAIFSLSGFTACTLIVSKQFAGKQKITAQSPLKEREAAIRAGKGSLRFGITTPGSLTDALTRMVLKQVGLDAARDATILPFQSLGNGLAALSNNAIDGFMSFSPLTEQGMLEFGAVPLLRIASDDIPAGKRLQGQLIEARPSDIQADPDLYAALVRACLRAQRIIVETPDVARDKLRRTRFDFVKEEIWPMVWQNELPTFKSPFVARESLQAWIDSGLVGGNPDPAKFPYDKVIDMRFVKEGLAKIGWTPPEAG